MHFFLVFVWDFFFLILIALFTLDSEFNNEQNILCDLQQVTLKWMVIWVKISPTEQAWGDSLDRRWRQQSF